MKCKEGLLTTYADLPTVLQINRESRAIGLELYRKLSPDDDLSSSNPYVCTSQDTVAVVDSAGESEENRIALLRQLCLGGVKYLVLQQDLALILQHHNVDLKLDGLDFVFGMERLFLTEGCEELCEDTDYMKAYCTQGSRDNVSFWILCFKRT